MTMHTTTDGRLSPRSAANPEADNIAVVGRVPASKDTAKMSADKATGRDQDVSDKARKSPHAGIVNYIVSHPLVWVYH